MIFRKTLFIGATLLCGAGAMAHQGVQNAAVKARMDSMSEIRLATKTLDDMAKGNLAFDQNAARKAAIAIADQAAKTPDLFREATSDPKSEALPAIWEHFEDFSSKAQQMESAAKKAADSIVDVASTRAALGEIGQTCKSCHSDYRMK